MRFSVPLVPILKNERDTKHWSWKKKEQERWLPFLKMRKIAAEAHQKEQVGLSERSILVPAFRLEQQIKRRLTITVHWGKSGRLPDQAGWIVGIQPIIDLLGTVKPAPYIRHNRSGRKTIVDVVKLGFIWDDSPEWCEIIYEPTVRDKKSYTEFVIE